MKKKTPDPFISTTETVSSYHIDSVGHDTGRELYVSCVPWIIVMLIDRSSRRSLLRIF